MQTETTNPRFDRVRRSLIFEVVPGPLDAAVQDGIVKTGQVLRGGHHPVLRGGGRHSEKAEGDNESAHLYLAECY